MRIGFNFLNSGLGNNGGTRTILKCGETLQKLGHEVHLIGTRDKFTWFEHQRPIPVSPGNLEVLIATSCKTVGNTLRARAKKKAWYIRGHETWTMDEKKLEQLYNSGILNIVSSNWLKEKLTSFGAKSTVIHQGLDFDAWQDKKTRTMNGKLRIGCLYNGRKSKRWSDFKFLTEILGTKDYEYVAFGNKACDDSFLNHFSLRPSMSALSDLYNSCHIWFAPTELEGLHNVPMEAALCGCLIICSTVKSNGMVRDYAFKNKTAMVYDSLEEAADMIRNPDWSLIPEMQKWLMEKIGSRAKNMMNLVELLA